MNNYLGMLRKIIREGYVTNDDRTGIGTTAIFGHQLRFDLQKGFPLVTTKEVHMHSIIHELLWMIKGDTNIKYLEDNKVRIWREWPHRYYVKQTGDDISLKEFGKRIREDDEFAKNWGELGPVYGHQWIHWGNQLPNVIDRIKTNPTCRRLIVSAWNAAEIDKMSIRGLPPCHCFFQFNIREGQYLDCQMYIRSWDTFLGGPFNIAQYALLTHMVANVTAYEVGDLVISSGNTHIYSNQMDQVLEQLKRDPYPLPTLKIPGHFPKIENIGYNDIILENYKCHPKLKADVAV